MDELNKIFNSVRLTKNQKELLNKVYLKNVFLNILFPCS
jgi:hypothetical protein